jgi:hypothetical protein
MNVMAVLILPVETQIIQSEALGSVDLGVEVVNK